MEKNDDDKITDVIYDFEKLKEPYDGPANHDRFASVMFSFAIVNEERLDLAVRATDNDPGPMDIWEKVETVVTNLDVIAVRAKLEPDESLGWLDLGLERVWDFKGTLKGAVVNAPVSEEL